MPISHQTRLQFAETVDRIYRSVAEAAHDDDRLINAVNQFDQPIFIKNEERVLVCTNKAFIRVVSGDQPTGRQSRSFLAPSFQPISDRSDELVLAGAESVECVHRGLAMDGFDYLMIFNKRHIGHLRRCGFAILGVVQVLERLEPNSERPNLGMLADKFRAFDDRDREICRRVVLGQNASDIGDALAMTSRNVEIRRKKCYDAMNVDKPVDLARLLVQMQERGFLDLGL